MLFKRKSRCKNNAFTLVEMILMIFLISSLILITSSRLVNIHNNNKVNKAAQLIGSILQKEQSKALNNNLKIKITISHKSLLIQSQSLINEEISSEIINLPTGNTITSNFNSNEIKINERGNVNQGGEIVIQNNQKIKKLIISIGNGKYRIE